MKICPKCKEAKASTEFYKRKSNKKDLLQSYCKECRNDYQKEYRQSKRGIAFQKKYRQSEKYKKYQVEIARAYSKRNPEKIRAKRIVAWAIISGRLKRMPCEVCGTLKAEGHHEDYSKPLDVRWLCRKHHVMRHKELKEIELNA